MGSVETEEKTKLIFWEKNGLLHGEFELPDLMGISLKINRMTWSKDSEILAVEARYKMNNLVLITKFGLKFFLLKVLYIK